MSTDPTPQLAQQYSKLHQQGSQDHSNDNISMISASSLTSLVGSTTSLASTISDTSAIVPVSLQQQQQKMASQVRESDLQSLHACWQQQPLSATAAAQYAVPPYSNQPSGAAYHPFPASHTNSYTAVTPLQGAAYMPATPQQFAQAQQHYAVTQVRGCLKYTAIPRAHAQ